MEDKSKSKGRRFWQISLRTLLVLVTLVGALLAFGSHFWRLTLQAKAHRNEAQGRLDWALQMGSMSFHIPQQYWITNEADREWHTAKEKECLHARWFPWCQVDDTSIPPPTGDNEAWPDWTTEWRRAQKR